MRRTLAESATSDGGNTISTSIGSLTAPFTRETQTSLDESVATALMTGMSSLGYMLPTAVLSPTVGLCST